MVLSTNKTVQKKSRVGNLRIIAFIFEWGACGVPHYCHRFVSFNTNEVSDTCTLWVPVFLPPPHPPTPALLGQVEFLSEKGNRGGVVRVWANFPR